MAKTKTCRLQSGIKPKNYGNLGIGKIKAEKPLPKNEPASAKIQTASDLRAEKG